MPQHQLPKDKTHPSREGTDIQKEAYSGRVKKSKSKDRLTIIPAPSVSLISGATESSQGGAILVLASSQLEVSELALADSKQQLADNGTDLQDGEYGNHHSQSEENEDEKDEDEDNKDVDNKDNEDELEQHQMNGNLSSGWGA